MKFIKICMVLLVHALLASAQDPRTLEEYEDSEIEEELRRRWLGGPWSPEEASSILHSSIDRLFDRSDTGQRPRRFEQESSYLIELITGDFDAQLSDQPDRRNMTDDDYFEEPFTVSHGHHVSVKTMHTILDMFEGANGQKKRSTDSIEKLYTWFRPSLITRFRQRLQAGGSRLSKLRAIDESAFGVFRQARNNKAPVHGRMLQRWARQAASKVGLDDFMASEGWLKRFKTA